MKPKVVSQDPVKPWFETLETMGEFIGIRYGRVDPQSDEVQWVYRPHKEFDGIGGFADILRERGIDLAPLPKITHPSPPSWLPLIKSVPNYLKPRKVLTWGAIKRGEPVTEIGPPPAVGWHVFSEEDTFKIRQASRAQGVTVNSFLMKHLDRAIRPALSDPSEAIPWMVPVNLRGKIAQARDSANHSSYVAIKINSYDSARDVHNSIHRRLRKGEHWANWKSYELTRSLPEDRKRALIDSFRAMSQWSIGSFSNLGVWDQECAVREEYCSAPWLFAPPVLRCQLLGAGCVTWQNRLSLTIQAHPDLSTSEDLAAFWIYRWFSEINFSLPK